jgi:pyridoxine 4-dehydrogenase
VLAELKRPGLMRHISLSNVTAKQVAEAQAITEIVCVQNFYNVAQRGLAKSRRRTSPDAA